MKTSKNIYRLLFMVLFTMPQVIAQDIRTSQNFYSNPLNVNPAIMGMNTDLKIILNYRSQWKNAGGGYNSYSLNGMYPLYMKDGKQKLDIGLNIANHQYGAFNNLKAGLALGYNLKLNKSGFLSFSMQGSYNQNNLDGNSLTFDDQYVLGQYSSTNSTNQVISNQNVVFANMSAGFMWYYNPSREDARLNAYFGISGFNLTQPNLSNNNSLDPLYRRFSMQGGVKILGDNKIDVMPNVVVNMQNGSEEIAAGFILDYHFSDNGKILFGAWYKKKDSYPIMLGVDVYGFSLLYSYDISSSYMSGVIRGLTTHSITLSYKLNRDKGKNTPSIY